MFAFACYENLHRLAAIGIGSAETMDIHYNDELSPYEELSDALALAGN
jgi:hypothetical protein